MQSRRDVQRQKSRVSGKQVLIRSLMTVLVLILVAWGSFAIATQPKTSAPRQAVSLAKKYADLRSFENFFVLLHGKWTESATPAHFSDRSPDGGQIKGGQAGQWLNQSASRGEGASRSRR